jgi:hypothetical protein
VGHQYPYVVSLNTDSIDHLLSSEVIGGNMSALNENILHLDSYSVLLSGIALGLASAALLALVRIMFAKLNRRLERDLEGSKSGSTEA